MYPQPILETWKFTAPVKCRVTEKNVFCVYNYKKYVTFCFPIENWKYCSSNRRFAQRFYRLPLVCAWVIQEKKLLISLSCIFKNDLIKLKIIKLQLLSREVKINAKMASLYSTFKISNSTSYYKFRRTLVLLKGNWTHKQI